MDITEINAIEYGGAIAHVAAAQLFQILTVSENMEGPAAVNWFGGEGDYHDAAATVLLLAEYVAKRSAGGERLWIWGGINGLVVIDVPESRQFADVPLARRLAFDMFASVCLRSFEQLTTLQEAEFAARQLEQRENPPIKLEDSIFEPTGSLGELETHGAQFVADAAAADARRAEGVDQVDEQSAPTDADPSDPPPPTMSIGAAAPATGEANEEEAADQGQEAGGEAAPDPDTQGSVPDGDAASLPEVPSSPRQDVHAAEQQARLGDGMAAAVAQPAGGEDAASADPAGDGVKAGQRSGRKSPK